MSQRIPLVQALSWIVCVTFVFSLVAHKVIEYSFFKKKKVLQTDNCIEYVIQTGPCKEVLQSDYFMEVLGLSADRPISFALFDPVAAQNAIAKIPIIKEVQVKKIKPNMAYIDYTLRKPFVWMADFSNAVLDRTGVIFPMNPFFSPKKIPAVYVGNKGLDEMGSLSFGSSLHSKYLDLAFSLLDLFLDKGKDLFFIKKVDVSKAFIPNLGKKEIVITLESEIYLQHQDKPRLSTHILRLSLQRFQEEISHYTQLRELLLEAEKEEANSLAQDATSLKPKVIDLKLEQLAFIQ